MIAMSDLFRVSLRQVVRQRGFGVILSIALGIMAFIALSVLGQEIRYKVGQDMVLMGGVNIIRVYMDDAQYPGQPRRDFSPRTVEALRKIPGVGMISENVRQGITFSLRASGERTLGVHFIGVDQYFATTYSLELVAGRMMSEEDVRGHRRICMLGREAATNLYGDPAQAVGKLLFLGKDVVEVVGVVTGVMLGEWNQGGFLPTTVMEDRNWGSGKITRLFVRAIGWEDVAPVVRQIPSVVRANQDAPYLVIATQDDQLDRIKTTFMWVEALLWLGIVASLMLGGFGIWYGTFAAVRARTREVGLKKAMGGSDKDILAQFLAEALCKSVAGGLLGILVGTLSVEIGAWSLGTSISYPLLAASSAGSILFSAIIGVAGGLYPAIQASRMDVVSALRFESVNYGAGYHCQRSVQVLRGLLACFAWRQHRGGSGGTRGHHGPVRVRQVDHAARAGHAACARFRHAGDPGDQCPGIQPGADRCFPAGQHGLRHAVEQYVRPLHRVRECGIPPHL